MLNGTLYTFSEAVSKLRDLQRLVESSESTAEFQRLQNRIDEVACSFQPTWVDGVHVDYSNIRNYV